MDHERLRDNWLQPKYIPENINILQIAVCYRSVQESPSYPDSKVHVANIGPIWVLSSPGGPHVGPRNLAIRVVLKIALLVQRRGPVHMIWKWRDGSILGWYQHMTLFHWQRLDKPAAGLEHK